MGGVGVNIHLTPTIDEDFGEIAAAGFHYVRTDFVWQRTEPTYGKYDFSLYDNLLAHLQAHNLRPVFILDYSNTLYEPQTYVGRIWNLKRLTNPPTHTESISAFARWAAAAATHFKDKAVIWEIWNEPDSDFFWPPQANARDYGHLAAATCSTLRNVDPTSIILGPALTTNATPTPDNPSPAFFSNLLAHPLMSCLSGFSVHPYAFAHAPDYALVRYQLIRTAFASQHISPTLPLVSGEWGYPTGGARSEAVSAEMQASYLIRMIFTNASGGIPLTIWYDWRDDGTNPRNKEHNFGLITNTGSPKPAYQAATVLSSRLSPARVIEPAKNLPAGVTGYRGVTTTGTPFTVLWPSSQTVQFSSRSLPRFHQAHDLYWNRVDLGTTVTLLPNQVLYLQ